MWSQKFNKSFRTQCPDQIELIGSIKIKDNVIVGAMSVCESLIVWHNVMNIKNSFVRLKRTQN